MRKFFNNLWPFLSETNSTDGKKETINEEENDIREDHIISLTYNDIKSLKETKKLDTSKQYLLNDFVTTTTQKYTKSAEHRFDILLTPVSENEFSKNVTILHHNGDDYFKNTDLTSWTVKYDFENNKNKYTWADTENGKGVIFYMRDEFNNECHYDFKNIMFKRWAIAGNDKQQIFYGNVDYKTEESISEQVDFGRTEFYYTFSTVKYGCQAIDAKSPILKNYSHLWVCDITVEPFVLPDECLQGYEYYYDVCFNNKIEPLYTKNGILTLNGNVFIGYPSYWKKEDEQFVYNITKISDNHICANCYGNTFCGTSISNKIQNNCSYNTFTDNCFENTLKEYCKYNCFLNGSNQNELGKRCNENVFFSSSNNTFGNHCKANVLKDSTSNNFSNSCIENILSSSSCNSFNVGCKSNKLCKSNQNSFGSFCVKNLCDTGFNRNHLGDECCENTFGDNSQDNTLYNNCSMNKFGIDTTFNKLYGNNYYVLIDDGVSHTDIHSNICGENKDNLLDKNLEPGILYKQVLCLTKENEIVLKVLDK